MTFTDYQNKEIAFDPEAILALTLKEIGTNIVASRKSKKLSQQKLSELSGLDRAYLSAVENGKQNITFAALIKISCALEIDFINLINSKFKSHSASEAELYPPILSKA